MPQLPDNFLFLNYPTDKYFILDPNLQANSLYASPDGKTITFTLTSQAIAPFVFLNLRDYTHGYFNENGFIMVETTKEIIYYSRDAITIDEFTSQLHITSLFDVTPFATDYDHDDDADGDADDDINSVCVIGIGAVPLLFSVLISFTSWFIQ